MKIGTLSLNINTDDLNYGAVLHSWAFLKYIKKNGLAEEIEVIDYTTPLFEKFERNHPIQSYIKMRRWKSVGKLIFSASMYQKRLKKFEKFVEDNMKVSHKSYTQKTLEEEKLNYDCLICESDVIWSPSFFKGKLDKVFFLGLDNMFNKKKIIYAASTANCDFSQKELEVFEQYIQFPNRISCREKYGSEQIRKCGRQDVETVIDPVLLLESNDYEAIMTERIIREPYLLIYIPLGYDKRYQKVATEYAKKNHLKVVEISYYIWNSISHIVMADAGIKDFLSLIKHADVIFTNSFHAVCFSCIFQKEFYAFKRKTGKKTEDLCERLALTERYMDIDDFQEKKRINYQIVEERLKAERFNSEIWLKSALEM